MKTWLRKDLPITADNEDKYSRRKYAQRIARLLQTNAIESCHTVGIQGRWGSGKTSLKNMVVEQLSAQRTPLKKNIILEYNPWTLKGSDQLVQHLFTGLSNLLPRKNREWKSRLNKCAHILGYAELILQGNRMVGNAKKLAEKAIQDISSTGFEAIASEIGEELAKSQKSAVIFLDDIDRLTDDEIAEAFRLVKAMSQIPGITFVLLYDRTHVANALAKVSKGKGDEYLEKIVQFPVNVPETPTDSITAFTENEISAIIQGVDADLSQADSRFRVIWNENITHYLRDPRRAIRYINSLEFQIAGLIDTDPKCGTQTLEVNLFDLIALESLKLFEPRVYERIYASRHELLGISDRHAGNIENELKKAALKDVTSDVAPESKRHADAIVGYLFPIRTSIQVTILDEMKELRLNHQDTFGRYFHFSVEPTDLSHMDVRSLAEKVANPEKFNEQCATLRDAGKRGYFEAFLRSQHLDSNNIRNTLFSLAHALDTHITKEDEGLSDLASSLVNLILRKVHNGSSGINVDALVEFIAECKGARIALAAAELLKESQYFERLRGIACQLTRERAHSGILPKTPKAHLLIAFWNKHARQDVERWVSTMINDPASVLQIIEVFKCDRTYNGVVEPALMYDYLASVFPVDAMYQTIITHKANSGHRISNYMRLFIEDYESRQHQPHLG